MYLLANVRACVIVRSRVRTKTTRGHQSDSDGHYTRAGGDTRGSEAPSDGERDDGEARRVWTR